MASGAWEPPAHTHEIEADPVYPEGFLSPTVESQSAWPPWFVFLSGMAWGALIMLAVTVVF